MQLCQVCDAHLILIPALQVLVYGDCAVNVQPSSKDLASIAAVSADTAAAFGIEPRVAMLSYSTLGSGAGPDVSVWYCTVVLRGCHCVVYLQLAVGAVLRTMLSTGRCSCGHSFAGHPL